jgi:putrescine aminotransferase
MSVTTHPLPATNEAGFGLIAEHLSPHKAAAYQAVGMDVVQGRREGVHVWDLEGRDYINCRSSGGVFNFGHSPSFAVEALTAALGEHDMGDWLLPSARRAEGAAALARLLPEPLEFTFFTA